MCGGEVTEPLPKEALEASLDFTRRSLKAILLRAYGEWQMQPGASLDTLAVRCGRSKRYLRRMMFGNAAPRIATWAEVMGAMGYSIRIGSKPLDTENSIR